MNPDKNIGEYLRANKSAEIERYMERSLADVFRIMFNLDLAQTPIAFPNERDCIPVHVMLYHENATACVSLRLLRNTAFLIAKKAGVEMSSALTPFILQDVACEMVSIISNNLRAYLSEKVGIYFEIGEIIVSEADVASLEPEITLNMNFQINPEAQLTLSFACGKGQGKKAASQKAKP
ncbi:MAG: hypothetical protein WC464_02315 [Bdellovibrionales bacterium]